jgi:ATP-binding cassette subfamily B (MDR/TAP) protein 1
MSLLFGDLTQDFVNFSTAIQNLDPNDPQSSAKVDEAAKRFRHVAAQDASYLVCIGA